MELRKSESHQENKDIIEILNEIKNENSLSARKTNVTSAKNKTPKISQKSNIHKNHRSRLKNQFLNNGIEALTDVQKLELMLFYSIPQKDTNPIAHELLNKFGSLKDVLSANQNELIKVNGVKENTALLIKLINDLINIYHRPSGDESLCSATKAKEFVSNLYIGINVEKFYVICLSKNNRVLKTECVESGTTDEVKVPIRKISEIAISAKCNRIIIAHNHPYGKAQMSDEDCSFTYSVLCSSILNSIEVIDHIIVGTDSAISLAQKGVLPKLKEKAYKTIQVPQDQQMLLSNLSENYEI